MTVYCVIVRNQGDSVQIERKQIFALLLAKLGLDPHQPIEKDKNGRPFLPLSPTADISLSHSDGFTVYAAGDTRLGIDMESPTAIREPQRLCRRFFTESEQMQVETAPDIARTVCEIWTKKEALAKYIGNGLSQNIHRDTTEPQKEIVFRSFPTTFSEKSYIITLCVHSDAHIIFLDPECFKF